MLISKGVLIFSGLLLITAAIEKVRAESLSTWQTAKDTHIAWHYEWEEAWKDYNVEVRNDYDYSVRLEIYLICGKERVVAFWSLKPGASASFLQRYHNGGPHMPLSLQVIDLEKAD
jgi:hypothetical protein